MGEAKYDLTAVVLAGGRSMRMGTDKTLMELGGQPLLIRAVEAVHPLATQTIVVTNRPDELPLAQLPDDIVVMTDEVAYQGPLGGIASACRQATNEWILTIAADMPWISQGIVDYLWQHRAGADVVIPIGPQGPEPLLALYRVAAVEPAAREVLGSGRRRIVAMFDELNVTRIERSDLEAIDPGLPSFFNINTRADYQKALSHVRKSTIAETTAADVAHTDTPIRLLSPRQAGRKMPSETPITVYLGQVEVATIQATATHIDDMAAGFLFAEGLLRDRRLLEHIDIDAKRGVVYVSSTEQVPDDAIHKTRYVTSGCGKGITFSSLAHARGIEPVTGAQRIDVSKLHDWMRQLTARSPEYRERGGCHSCGLVVGGELVLVREDIGRHNAVDKLLGHAWLEGIDTANSVLLASGRTSYEMVVKAARSRIPLVASRTAATDLAAEIADELNMTLVGYVRGGKAIAYTHPERITTQTPDAGTPDERAHAPERTYVPGHAHAPERASEESRQTERKGDGT